MSEIRLSIITALYKSDSAVFATHESVVGQLGDGVEWVIKNSDYIAAPEVQNLAECRRVKIVNEPDQTLYQGLNQALKYCEGEYIWVVGAGDRFFDSAVELVLSATHQIELHQNAESICFPVYHRKLNGVLMPDPTRFGPHMSCPHPGVILKKKHICAINGFDERYEIAADFDLLLRYFYHWPKIATGQAPVIDFQGGGISETRINEAAVESDLARLRFERKKMPVS